jgi:glycosyltransferase involved in cell wall biosynthesis
LNPELSIIVPLLNEAESLPELAEWIKVVADQNAISYELIFVDDGSRDKSWEIIEKLSAENDAVKGIKFRRNYGKSAALHTGFQRAQGSIVITMDADLQDSPEEIPGLMKMLREGNYDLVSGWKKKRHDPLSKTIPTRLYNWATRKMSGIQLHDFNCGLKAYNAEVVHNIALYGEMHRYIPVIAKWAGFTRIGEKTVQHQARKYGSSKFGIERFVNGFLDLLTIFFVGKFGKRPMHFFGTFGIISFMIGLLILIYLSIEKIWFSQIGIATRPLFFLGMLTVIVGTQLFLTGFLAELMVRNNPDRDYYQIEKEI